MKKLYTLLMLTFIGGTALAQPVLTAVLDGPCTGGVPKILEIYAKGTVDFTQFTLQNRTNSNTTWGAAQDLSSFGTRTNQFVYVIYTNNALSLATAEYPTITAANSLESGTMNLNGDDSVRIINTASTTVIDQFGAEVDGTDLAWEWLDSAARRNNGTGPDGAFVIGNWTISPINSLDNTGTCTGNKQLANVYPLGNYSLGVAQNAIAGLTVYPNPVVNGNLYITSDSGLSKSVVVYDVLGKQVAKANVIDQPVNVSNLKGGVYIVKITEDGKTATRKVIIR